MMDLIVIGGGPAGSSAAIRLAQTGQRVRLYEKAIFPRAKLCGGFLSPESLIDLEQLGVLARLREAGALPVERVVVSSCRGRVAEAPLKHPGLSLSRKVLDRILLERAREVGVDIHENENGLGHEDEARWTIQAFGRKGSPVGLTGIQAYFENMPGITNQVELDIVRGGYVGLLRQEAGVNVCALTNRAAFSETGADLDAVLETWKTQNPLLEERMRHAKRITPWLAVGPISMGMHQLTAERTFFVGDAACVVDPFAGEGLAMALRSANLLQNALATQSDPQRIYEQAWHKTFDSSLRFHEWTRFGMSHRYGHELLVYGLHAFPAALTWLTTMTRPPLYEHPNPSVA
jgi:menaquinone-9 beta-reductase